MTVGQIVALRTREGVAAGRRMVGGRTYSARDLAIPAYLIILGVFVVFRLLSVPPWLSPAFDLHAYWSTHAGLDYTTTRPGDPGAYLYSPAFAQVIYPLTAVSWPVFAAAWTAFVGCLLVWLSGRWAILLVLLPPVAMSIVIGQVDLLMAAAIVIGFRWPAAWALPILTKVTPGVGLLWFAVRREWRSLAIALGATAAIVAVSAVIDLQAWLGWIAMLGRGQFPRAEDGWYFDVPLGVRLAIAVVVVIWGARTDRRWTVPLAAMLGMPTVWINSPTILIAFLPLIAAGAGTPAGRWLRRWDAAAEGATPLPGQDHDAPAARDGGPGSVTDGRDRDLGRPRSHRP